MILQSNKLRGSFHFTSIAWQFVFLPHILASLSSHTFTTFVNNFLSLSIKRAVYACFLIVIINKLQRHDVKSFEHIYEGDENCLKRVSWCDAMCLGHKESEEILVETFSLSWINISFVKQSVNIKIKEWKRLYRLWGVYLRIYSSVSRRLILMRKWEGGMAMHLI